MNYECLRAIKPDHLWMTTNMLCKFLSPLRNIKKQPQLPHIRMAGKVSWSEAQRSKVSLITLACRRHFWCWFTDFIFNCTKYHIHQGKSLALVIWLSQTCQPALCLPTCSMHHFLHVWHLSTQTCFFQPWSCSMT